MVMKLAPPRLVAPGSVRLLAKIMATAASTALPPASRISMPMREVYSLALTTAA